MNQSFERITHTAEDDLHRGAFEPAFVFWKWGVCEKVKGALVGKNHDEYQQLDKKGNYIDRFQVHQEKLGLLLI